MQGRLSSLLSLGASSRNMVRSESSLSETGPSTGISLFLIFPSRLHLLTTMAPINRAIPRLARSLRPQVSSQASTISRRTVPTPQVLVKRFAATTPARSDKFTKLTSDHVSQLRSFLSSPSSLLTTLDGSASEDDLASYNNDWLNKYHGKSQIVVKPRSTEEVSKVVAYCYENDIAIVPQGGNTGLVGTCMMVEIFHHSC